MASHFVALGGRAMSHDEGIHAYLSWELFEHATYSHDPTYHGPLLYHLNAVVYSLFGDSDATSRWGPAAAGVLLLLSILGLRRYLGEAGAVAAGAMAVISPALLFYGRYLTADMYLALFSALWAIAVLRYLEQRRWRWLLLLAVAMALSFAAKETAFITGSSLGSFVAMLAIARIRRGAETWRSSPAAELAATMLLIVLPFAAPVVHLLAGWDPLDYDSAEALRRGMQAAGALGLAATAIAALVFRGAGRPPRAERGLTFGRWLSLFALFWGIQLALFTSGFKNVPRGALSGVVGSLGYWLGQHEVARGAQPGHYYLTLLALYEFLPLLLALAAAVALWRRRAPASAALDQPPGPSLTAGWLLFWWTLTTLAALSVAGEKMPWLTVYIALPMVLLAGWWLGPILERVDWQRWRGHRAWLPALLPLLLLHSASRLLGSDAPGGRTLEAIARSTDFLYALGSALVAVFLGAVWLRRRRGEGTDQGDGRRLLGLGLVAALALFTAQVSWRLTFRDDELATEPMVYAHATPDIKRALSDADDLARRAGLEGEVPIAFDAESSWPFNWYLRNHRRKLFLGDHPTAEVTSYPIILSGAASEDSLWPLLGAAYARRDLNLIWWPIERLTKFTLRDATGVLADPAARRAAWRYIAARELPERAEPRWPNRREFRMYVHRDLLDRAWGVQPGSTATSAALQEVRVEPLGSLFGPFAGEPLRMPTQLTVTADGTRVVADAGNDRVVLFARDGALVRVIDGACREGEPCLGPLEEPWGVAALPGGDLAIADTWRGRIRYHDVQGRPLGAFGEALVVGAPPFPTDRFYGPRGLSYHPPSGRLLIADTGHHRLLARAGTGEMQEVGGPGDAAGAFQEPVGLVFDPADATVLVADTWNQRIQRLDRELAPISSWPVPGWHGRGPYNKPYLAVDGRGLVYASDPEAARILVFDRDGTPLGAMVSVGWRGAQRSVPLGVAVDLVNRELLVSDATLGRVWTLPLWP